MVYLCPPLTFFFLSKVGRANRDDLYNNIYVLLSDLDDFMSVYCFNIEGCPNGTYGPGCRRQCRCENGAECDHISGGCTCTPGWRGMFCSKPCPDGYYGLECQVCSQLGHFSHLENRGKITDILRLLMLPYFHVNRDCVTVRTEQSVTQ